MQLMLGGINEHGLEVGRVEAHRVKTLLVQDERECLAHERVVVDDADAYPAAIRFRCGGMSRGHEAFRDRRRSATADGRVLFRNASTKRAPPRGCCSTHSSPPNARASPRAMCNPRPWPSFVSSAVRIPRSKMRSLLAGF